jgi:hypothetical protein
LPYLHPTSVAAQEFGDTLINCSIPQAESLSKHLPATIPPTPTFSQLLIGKQSLKLLGLEQFIIIFIPNSDLCPEIYSLT